MTVTIGGADTMPESLGGRLQRRVTFELRRDAAEVLSNGRVLYDALFSRTGIQTYGDSVEYRPPDEVFAPASLASGALCPGVLLHPAKNFGTNFGEGSYPVRGTSGAEIVQAADGIHTAGRLMVWDQEWNDAIARDAIAELSVGYTIEPDYTPGVAPDGTAYNVVHRDIVWDHIAGVPAGNAETARVVLDAARASEGLRRLATRAALARIAEARADARPLYYVLGTWPSRRDSADAEPEPEDTETEPEDQPAMDETAKQVQEIAAKLDAGGPITAKIIHDAFIDVWGDSDDPAMQRVCAALGGVASSPAPAVTDAEGSSSEEPEGEGERMDAAAIEAEVKRRVDAELPKRIAVELEPRADALAVARMALGSDYKHDGKSTAEMRLDVVRKVLPAKAKRIDRLDAADQRTAIALGFEDARDVLDAQLDYGERLAESINAERDRADAQGEVAPELADMAKRMDAQTKAAGSQSFGSQPQPRPAT